MSSQKVFRTFLFLFICFFFSFAVVKYFIEHSLCRGFRKIKTHTYTIQISEFLYTGKVKEGNRFVVWIPQRKGFFCLFTKIIYRPKTFVKKVMFINFVYPRRVNENKRLNPFYILRILFWNDVTISEKVRRIYLLLIGTRNDYKSWLWRN